MSAPVRISVVIPTYNRAHYLKTAIYSCLQQDYPNFEVIVSDNASSDNTQQMITTCFNDQRLKYYRNETNLGAIGNIRKAAFEHAAGDWFIVLSDDDYFVDYNYLSLLNQRIQQDTQISLVLSGGYILFEKEQQFIHFTLPYAPVEQGKTVFFNKGRLNQPNYILCNVAYPTQLSKTLMQGFNNPLNGSGDAELFYKLAAYGKVGYIDSATAVYRIHQNNYVTQHVKNLDLLLNSLMGPVETIRLVKQHGWLTQTEIQQWEQQHVVAWIETIMSQIYLTHPKKYDTAQQFLIQHANEYIEHCNLTTPQWKIRLKHYAYKLPMLSYLATKLKHLKDQRYRKPRLVTSQLKQQLLSLEQQGYDYHA